MRLAIASGCLAACWWSAPLVAQDRRPDEPPPPAADTARADTLVQVLPDSMRVRFGEDTLDVGERRDPAFPAPVERPDGFSYEVREWDRDDLLASNALSLLDFLTAVMPGFTPVRAGYFNGPHQIIEGVFGAGFVRIRLNGREMPPLEGGEDDLVRFPVVYLDKIRVTRSASGLTIDLYSRRHHEPRAYSRIAGGTGTPSMQMIRGIFSNGWGGAVTFGTAFDLLNVTAGDAPSDRFDFWAGLALMPGSNRAGVQLDWQSQTIDPTGDDVQEATRRDIALRGRFLLRPDLALDVSGSTTSLSQSDSTLVDFNQGSVSLSGNAPWGFGSATVSARGGGDAYPSLNGAVAGGFRVAPWLSLDVEAQAASWEEFSTSSVRGGLSIRPSTPFDLVLRGEAATGTRGLSRPLSGTADSLSFDAARGSLEITLGPYRIGGAVSYQSLSRQLPFGAPFDSALAVGPAIDVNAFEGELTGPVVPLGSIIRGLNPLVISGFFRRQEPSDTTTAYYLPEDVARGRLGFSQRFFEDDLLVQLALGLIHRSAMLSSAEGSTTPVEVPSLTRFNWDFILRIKDFQIWWRSDNLSREVNEDVLGRPYPTLVNIFGVKWEFFN